LVVTPSASAAPIAALAASASRSSISMTDRMSPSRQPLNLPV